MNQAQLQYIQRLLNEHSAMYHLKDDGLYYRFGGVMSIEDIIDHLTTAAISLHDSIESIELAIDELEKEAG